MRTLFLLLLLLPFSTPPFAASSEKASVPKKARDASYNPDIDLKSAPDYYRERIIRFRNILRKEPTRKAKISKAITLAKDQKSPYRSDAISFLGEVRATETVPMLIGLSDVREDREFVLHALGKMRDARAIPVFIKYLEDDNEDVRGNAAQALENTARRQFEFDYAAPPKERANTLAQIRSWWANEKDTFKVPRETAEEKKEADEVWERYGQQYLYDLTR